MRLSAAQTNSLRTVLRILEKRVDEINALCEIKEQRGLLYSVKNTLSDQQIKQLKQKIIKIKGIIEELTNKLKLEREESDLRRIIESYLSASWEDLCSTTSKGLRAYGAVDVSVKAELDPVIEQLNKLLLSMINLLEVKK
ncbi:MAG: hypothetical protein N2246_03645 [Candidatus Sumerlaeia bacterium]|nr:hypothetical protein [Candidatus Sumerlaeia bacterium]